MIVTQPVNNETLGARLYRLRCERGWSQRMVANKLGLRNHTQIGFWENERRRPELNSLRKLADLYSVPLSTLLESNEGVQGGPGELCGDRIRRLRENKGWTRNQLSVALHTSRTLILQWERGDVHSPSMRSAEGLARIFGVSKEYILSGREDPIFAALKAQIKQRAPYERLLAMVFASET